MSDHITIDKSYYAGTGLTEKDLQFDFWCPMCDEVVKFQMLNPYCDEMKCLSCNFRDDRFELNKYPKGINPKAGNLILIKPETKLVCNCGKKGTHTCSKLKEVKE